MSTVLLKVHMQIPSSVELPSSYIQSICMSPGKAEWTIYRQVFMVFGWSSRRGPKNGGWLGEWAHSKLPDSSTVGDWLLDHEVRGKRNSEEKPDHLRKFHADSKLGNVKWFCARWIQFVCPWRQCCASKRFERRVHTYGCLACEATAPLTIHGVKRGARLLS